MRLRWELQSRVFGSDTWTSAYGPRGDLVSTLAWDCPYLRDRWKEEKSKSWVAGVRLVAWVRKE